MDQLALQTTAYSNKFNMITNYNWCVFWIKIDNGMHIDFSSKMGCSKNFSKMSRAPHKRRLVCLHPMDWRSSWSDLKVSVRAGHSSVALPTAWRLQNHALPFRRFFFTPRSTSHDFTVYCFILNFFGPSGCLLAWLVPWMPTMLLHGWPKYVSTFGYA